MSGTEGPAKLRSMRRFFLRTFGCQMNQHDAEKLGNLLHHQGFSPSSSAEDADLVLIHTCSIREKAEQKLYTEIGILAKLKAGRPELVLGVGGCVAQQEGAKLLKRFPVLDFVFGPQNITHLPAMVARAAEHQRSLWVDYDEDPQRRFELPERHPEFESVTPGRAFVTVMEGCDLFCTYCVVPKTRGREVSRSSGSIVEEAQRCADRGVVEITLLGQTVNAYGRTRPGQVADEIPFAELIRRISEIDGIERIRFTSPHPIFVSDDLIHAYGEIPELCPHLHLPVQSGSNRVLEAMNRRYTREDYLDLVTRLRAVRGDIALTTDWIVGFPGETEAEFEATLSLLREVKFVDSFSFKYSERPETPAQRRGLIPMDPAEAGKRLEALQLLQRDLTLAAHQARVGSKVTILVEGTSRRGVDQQRGRCEYNRVVNFVSPAAVQAGSIQDVEIIDATPHSLLAVTALTAAAPRSLELPIV